MVRLRIKNRNTAAGGPCGHFGSPKGFSLIELLVATTLALIVLTVMFTMFRTTSRSYSLQDYVAEMQQNLRVGLHAVSRDVRMAGCGLNLISGNITNVQVYASGAWNQVPPITGTNSTSGPDSISVFYGNVKGGVYDATLTAALPNAGAPLMVDSPTPFTPADGIVVTNGLTATFFVVSQVAGFQLQHDPTASPFNPPAGASAFLAGTSYAVGARAYNYGLARWVTYSINTAINPGHPTLVADMHDGFGLQTVADNIEDMQFLYTLSNGGTTWNPVGSENLITSVRITLVARTDQQDQDALIFSPETPVEDHVTLPGPTDGYRRRALTTEVKIRNR